MKKEIWLVNARVLCYTDMESKNGRLSRRKKEKYAEVCVLDDADAYAEKCGTISYEVLVRAAERAVKIYVGG